MTVQSVIQIGCLQDKPCIAIHPWTPYCRNFFFRTLRKSVFGSIGLFGILGVLKLALKLRRDGYRFEHVLKSTSEILRSSAFASLTVSSSLSLTCILRAVMGRFTDYTAIFLPVSLGSFFIVAEQLHKWNMVMFMQGNAVMEYFLRSGLRRAGKPASPRLLTALFMMTSAILLEILSRPQFRQLIRSGDSAWVYYPTVENETKHRDLNKLELLLYETKVIGKLVGNGLILQLGQIILKNFSRPSYIIRKIFHFNTYRLGLFLGTYCALFKTVLAGIQCLDERNLRQAWHGIVAGFVAGAALLIYPDSFIAVMASTTLIQIMCKLLCQKGYISHKWLWKYLFICSTFGWLVHIYFVDPYCTSKWFSRSLEAASDLTVKDLRKALFKEWGVAQFPIVSAGIF